MGGDNLVPASLEVLPLLGMGGQDGERSIVQSGGLLEGQKGLEKG